MSRLLPGWGARTQVQRVELYTCGSLYVLFWVVLGAGVLNAANQIGTGARAGSIALGSIALGSIALGAVVLGIAGTAVLRESMRIYPAYAPVPWRHLGVLVVLVVAAEAFALTLSDKGEIAAILVALPVLGWGAGGLRDRRVQVGLVVGSGLVPFIPTGSIGLAAYGVGVCLFLIFTVQSSLWLLEVVTELERRRSTQAALAVAEERLRFSRDVHDVLGRRLSTIAVQAELAATLAERGDPRAPDRIREVRETAHHALREARELARGYRPLDLHAEIDGAVALLRSAGITAHADLDELPEAWHEPVARVIREAVTNVLRHSEASHVEMSYAEGQLVVRNDGASSQGDEAGAGSGLVGLTEHLAPVGATLQAAREGDAFVVRVQLAPDPPVRAEAVEVGP